MSGRNLLKITEALKQVAKMSTVVRSPGPPRIWDVIEKTGKDGRPIKFTIQEIPEDRSEEAVDHMCTHFLADEPTCACFNAINTPIFVEECRTLWRGLMEQRMAIAAFVDNPKGGKPIIAGMNVLSIEFKENAEKKLHFQSKFGITYKVMSDLTKQLQLYERYGVEKYMFAVGLSVAPAFRGYGLGTDLLKTRDKIGREYNIRMTSTAFTSPFSKKSAERAGFELLLSRDYTDLVDENGKEYFPGIQKFSNTIVIMAKRI
ncbi:uncharacterized protein LOC116844821 [Odontomachus brunneus]|uniref:uncharacterized protein LOC116844821 n=1 Tax=Odontomachus brunneus TaxID=486640 RepID=UPI0013F1D2F1|nr:uncharacterized protein LOC116844821 [Odontomachus brunneus]